MMPLLSDRSRAYAGWLFLLAIRGALLAALIAIGAAVTRDVTSALQWAAYGGATRGGPAPAIEQPLCASPPSRTSCAIPRALPAGPV